MATQAQCQHSTIQSGVLRPLTHSLQNGDLITPQVNLSVAVAVGVNAADQAQIIERALLAWTGSSDLQMFFDSLDVNLVRSEGIVVTASYTSDGNQGVNLIASGATAASVAGGSGSQGDGGDEAIAVPSNKGSSAFGLSGGALAGLLIACAVPVVAMGALVGVMRQRHRRYRHDVERLGPVGAPKGGEPGDRASSTPSIDRPVPGVSASNADCEVRGKLMQAQQRRYTPTCAD